MTEPLRKYRSSDVPEFASYPAEPDRATAEVIEFSVISEYDALPETFARGFDEQGRKIGSALGRLVHNFNEMTSSFRSKVHEQVQRAEDGIGLAKDAAAHTYEDATRKVRNVAQRGLCEARTRATELRRRTVRTVNDYPVQTLAAIGVAGVIAGVGLRVWRQNRD